MTPRTSDYFRFARERHSIYLRRRIRQPPPWTDDSVLREFKFTNIFRELDRTTIWYRLNVREPTCRRAGPVEDILLATVLFRWFCKIEVGEALFQQPDLEQQTAARRYIRHGDTSDIKTVLRALFPNGPFVTGAYVVKTPDGVDKLAGVCQSLGAFWTYARGGAAGSALRARAAAGRSASLQETTDWLAGAAYLGPFMAYEVVTDLRHTPLLCDAPDILTWANPGPGARRGLNRLFSQSVESSWRTSDAIDAMRDLLAASQDPLHWPKDWPSWEMREVEHTLCEWDKYERARTGEGRPKQRYTPSANALLAG